jgi:hypothetical protein
METQLMRRCLRVARAAGGAVALLALAAACAGSPGGSTSAADQAARFAAMFEGYEADYQPAASPAELAGRSTLVVSGRIEQIVPGIIYPETSDASATDQDLVMRFRVDQVLAGALPAGADSLVYVDLPATYGQTAASFDLAAPKHAPALLYLVQMPDPRTWEQPVLNPDAGRPSGQPLMAVTTPQGFVVSAGTDRVVVVLEHTAPAVSSLNAFLPSATTAFPDVGNHN